MINQQSLFQSITICLVILTFTPLIFSVVLQFNVNRSVRKQKRADMKCAEIEHHLHELRREQAEIQKQMAAELKSNIKGTALPLIDTQGHLYNIETQMQEIEYWNKRMRRKFLTSKQRKNMRNKCWPYIENVTSALLYMGIPAIEITKATPFTQESINALLDKNNKNQITGR